MDRTSFKSQGIMAFGVSMVLGGIALLLCVAMLGLGTQSALANGVNGPLAQGTQPIPQLTATPTGVATREPTATTVVTGTVGATVTAVGTVVATGTVEATTTAVGTVVGTVVATTTSEATVAATSTSIPVATTEPLPTEGTGMIETPTPISVGMPRTGSPVGGNGNNGLTLTLLIIGVMMTTVGLASLAARKSSYKR